MFHNATGLLAALDAEHPQHDRLVTELNTLVASHHGKETGLIHRHVFKLADAHHSVALLAMLYRAVVGPGAQVPHKKVDGAKVTREGDMPSKLDSDVHSGVLAEIRSAFPDFTGSKARDVFRFLGEVCVLSQRQLNSARSPSPIPTSPVLYRAQKLPPMPEVHPLPAAIPAPPAVIVARSPGTTARAAVPAAASVTVAPAPPVTIEMLEARKKSVERLLAAATTQEKKDQYKLCLEGYDEQLDLLHWRRRRCTRNRTSPRPPARSEWGWLLCGGGVWRGRVAGGVGDGTLRRNLRLRARLHRTLRIRQATLNPPQAALRPP